MTNGEIYTALGALSSIRTGQTFKRAWEQYPAGDIAVFLPRDIADEQPDKTQMIKISADEIPALDKHLLKEGDVMMVNKGIRLNHFLYQGIPVQAVATTAFYIITTKSDLLPGFLNWYLGQQEAKNYFALNARGTTISGISKSVLEQLPVPVIPLPVQEYIVKVDTAAQEEQALTTQLLLQKQAFTDSFLWEQINKHAK